MDSLRDDAAIAVEAAIRDLVERMKALPGIEAIGLSSDPLLAAMDEGDIDIFIYCSSIPGIEERGERYPDRLRATSAFKPGIFADDTWGDADYTEIHGIETWIMYFVDVDVKANYDRMLEGRDVESKNGYYPTGRLAMFRKMRILYERGSFLSDLKEGLSEYPLAVKRTIIETGLERMMDEEDLIRACERRDLLFFHVSIDAALDALLQYLFAINETLFPSRKRNMEYLKGFRLRPNDLEVRIRAIIGNGSTEEGMVEAFDEFRRLRGECIALDGEHRP